MSDHTYSRSVCAGDALRAATGMALVAVPLVWAETGLPVTIGLAAVLLIFAAYGVCACLRLRAHVHLDTERISATGPWQASVQFCELKRVRLAYYSTRHDREQGWFRMSVEGARNERLILDSRLSDFDLIALRVATAARHLCVPLDAISLNNFRALGITIEDQRDPSPP